jgi:hypothetical protein
VRVVAERVDELADVLVHHGVHRDLVRVKSSSPLRVGSSPFSRSADVSRNDELLGELLDGVAAVLEDALVAVDERDAARGGRRVHERRVIGHEPEVGVLDLDLAQVHRA